jgi:hypothetical protein
LEEEEMNNRDNFSWVVAAVAAPGPGVMMTLVPPEV